MDSACFLRRFCVNNFFSSAGSVARVNSVDCKNTLSCQMHAVHMLSRVQVSPHEYSCRTAMIRTQYTRQGVKYGYVVDV